jgi:hypothetical protein
MREAEADTVQNSAIFREFFSLRKSGVTHAVALLPANLSCCNSSSSARGGIFRISGISKAPACCPSSRRCVAVAHQNGGPAGQPICAEMWLCLDEELGLEVLSYLENAELQQGEQWHRYCGHCGRCGRSANHTPATAEIIWHRPNSQLTCGMRLCSGIGESRLSTCL